MPGEGQPLTSNQPIVNSDGMPTQYFIRWAQDRQIDITGAISAEQALVLIQEWAADRDVFAGAGLSGGGNLSADVTIDHETSLVLPGSYTSANITVDEFGHVTAAANGSGGGGGGLWWFDPPAAADFPTIISINASVPTVTDDADIGMTLQWIGVTANNDGSQGCFKPLPAGVDWTLETHYLHTAPAENYRYGGLCVRVGATGRALTFSQASFTGSAPITFVLGQIGQSGQNNNSNLWWNATRDIFVKLVWTQATTTLTMYGSLDGKNWTKLYTTTSGAFLGAAPDQIGFKVHAAVGGGTPSGQFVLCDRWVQSW